MIYLVLIFSAGLNSLFVASLGMAIGTAFLALTYGGEFYWEFEFFWPHQVGVNSIQLIEIFFVSLLLTFLARRFFNNNLKFFFVLGIFILVHLLIIFVPSLFIKIVDMKELTPVYEEQSFDFSKEVLVTDNTGKKDNLHILDNRVFWVQNMELSLSPMARNFSNGLQRDLLFFEFDSAGGKGEMHNLTNGDGDVAAQNVTVVDSKVFWVWDDGKYNKTIYSYDFESRKTDSIVSKVTGLYKATTDYLFYDRQGKYLYDFKLRDSEFLNKKMIDVVAGEGNYACYENERYDTGFRETDLVRYDLVTKNERVIFSADSQDFEYVSLDWCGEKYFAFSYKLWNGEFGTKVLNIDSGKEVFERELAYMAGMKFIGEDFYFSEGGEEGKINKVIYKYNLVDQDLEVLYERDEGIAYWDTDGEYLVFIQQGEDIMNSFDTGPIYLVPLKK